MKYFTEEQVKYILEKQREYPHTELLPTPIEGTIVVKKKGSGIVTGDIFWWQESQQWQVVIPEMCNGKFFYPTSIFLIKV
jgi:hypothetical protein